MITYIPEIHRIHTGRVNDPTEPHPTPPALHEIDRAADIVVHHVSEQCHVADRLPVRRNAHLIHALIVVDLGGPDLSLSGLVDLVNDWPPAGEFPAYDVADYYTYRVHAWLREHGYGGAQ